MPVQLDQMPAWRFCYGVEHVELEEMQGVVGLKALRVEVLYEEEKTEQVIELSTTTSQQLIGK